MRKFTLHIFFLLLIFGFLNIFGEGTPQAMPTSSNGVALISDPATGIGSSRACPSTQRIKLRIKDFNTEKIYFGLNGRVRTPGNAALTNGYYRIYNPSGTLVSGPIAIPTSGTGFI